MLDPLTKGYLTLHPDAAAHTLLQLKESDLRDILEAMPRALAATVLDQMAPAAAGRCLAHLSNRSISEIVAHMPLPTSVALLRHMQSDQVRELLERMPRMLALRLRLGLRYAESLVGGYVDVDAVTFSPAHHVGDALRLYRREGQRTGHTIYVLDQQRALAGEVHLDDLLSARDRTLVSRIMRPVAAVLSARASLQSVARHPAWLTNDCLPVISRGGTYLGVLMRDKAIAKHEELIGTVVDQSETAITRAALADILWMSVGALLMGGTSADADKRRQN